MIINADTDTITKDKLVAQVCIVGAGAAGITLALELANKKISVLLIEAGGTTMSEHDRSMLDGEVISTETHAGLMDARCRQLGGTTAIWGGRCIPFDSIDFETRSYVAESGWPISYTELEKYMVLANDYCQCGSYQYSSEQALPLAPKSIVPGFHSDNISCKRLERWSLPTNFGKEYNQQLAQNPYITVVLGVTCTNITVDEQSLAITHLNVSTKELQELQVSATEYSLCMGGLETTRLLLSSNNVMKKGLGNFSGLLGRYYMGHLSGTISNVQFSTDWRKTIYHFEKDKQGIYVRRRFWLTEHAQKKLGLLNTVFWLDNAPMYDHTHRNGILSSAYIALNTPLLNNFLAPKSVRMSATGGQSGQYLPHLYNIAADLPTVARFMPDFIYKRYLKKRKLPGFFLQNRANKYKIHYHAEQIPNYHSVVSLSSKKDKFGLPKLSINLRYSDKDYQSVEQAHQLFDSELRNSKVGQLEYTSNLPIEDIKRQAGDGIHQIGTTRMSDNERHGVVDRDGKVFGTKNLYLCSSSMFPTSSQANPTLTIVGFAIRQADCLHNKISHS